MKDQINIKDYTDLLTQINQEVGKTIDSMSEKLKLGLSHAQKIEMNELSLRTSAEVLKLVLNDRIQGPLQGSIFYVNVDINTPLREVYSNLEIVTKMINSILGRDDVRALPIFTHSTGE